MKTVSQRPSRHGNGFLPTRVMALDVADGIPEQIAVTGYRQALILLKFRGRPVGCVTIPCEDGHVSREAVTAAIDREQYLTWRLGREPLRQWLLNRQPHTPRTLPSWSVIVCTALRNF